MGLWDRIARSTPTKAADLWGSTPAVVYPAPHGNGWVDLPVEYPWGGSTTAWSGQVPVLDPPVALEEYAAGLRALDPEVIWKSQPSVRKVIDFIARGIAGTPIKAYNRVSDDVRRLESNSDLGALLRQPQQRVAPFRFWHSVVCDWLLYDKWAAIISPADTPAGVELVQIPSWRLRFENDGFRRVTRVGIWEGDDNGRREPIRWLTSLDDVVYDFGYKPKGAGGLSPIQTLAEILAERMEAIRWRRQTWRNGARMSGWIERPLEANELEGWDETAEERFQADFDAKYRANGPEAGGAPLLKDGMKYHDIKTFSADDMSDLEHRKLSDVEVTSAYHIAPEMVGAREGNYSNLREFRAALYRDGLGGYFAPIKQALNLMVVPRFAGRKRLYVDFDIASKVKGSFEERAALTSTAVGAPWMTRNEARAEENKPPIDGGDELITPLNVTTGAQPSPQTPTGDGSNDNTAPPESPPEPKRRGLKAVTLPETTRTRLLDEYVGELAAFVDRQRVAVLSGLGAKSIPPLPAAWNGDRWDRELSVVMVKHLLRSAELRGALVASQLDSELDSDALLLLVTGRASGVAAAWNGKTYDELAEAIQLPDWKTAAGEVFNAAGNRAGRLAQSTTTELTTRAALLAADKAGLALKRWVVRSKAPRASHAAMAGETVPVDGVFSNGARHPGDGSLPTAERAHCTCDIEIMREDS